MCLQAIFLPSLSLCFNKVRKTGCLVFTFLRGLYEIGGGTSGRENCHIQV